MAAAVKRTLAGATMMYSPGLMAERPDIEELEKRVDELESLADALDDVPDEKLVEVLGRAVELLKEVNAGIEAGLDAAGTGSGELNSLLERVDFGAFDAALGELEEQERTSDERGP